MKSFRNVFLFIALIVILADFGLLYLNYKKVYSDESLSKNELVVTHKKDTVDLVRKKIEATVPLNSFNLGVTEQSNKIFQDYFDSLKSEKLFRIKVWNTKSEVIWSNTPELIGKKFTDNHELEEALEGEVEVEIDRKDLLKTKTENRSEHDYSNFSEVYVPILNSKGEVVGVIEVYQAVSDIVTKIDGQFIQNSLKTVVFSMLILTAVGFLFKKTIFKNA